MDAVLHLAESLMGSPWLYLLVLGLTAVDGFLPIVPGETVVIAAGTYAVTGEPNAVALLVAAWIGALCGDVISHHLGRGAGPLARWFRRRRWGGALLGWADRELTARGGMLLVSARFIPGGRTATTLTSGIVRFPRSRFVGFAALAGVLWALYYVGVGMLGGLAFQQQPLLGVAMGIGTAIVLGGGIELVRSLRGRRRSQARSSSVSPAPDRPASSRSQARSSSVSPAPDRPTSSRSQARSSSVSPPKRAALGVGPAPAPDAP
ncbi:DedA family protein [Brachybacterium sp.]|uniref:DedA family protein n=1 Tax=Brachybacterium sp. TaxID=1891286 RepID=UPI003F8EAD72